MKKQTSGGLVSTNLTDGTLTPDGIAINVAVDSGSTTSGIIKWPNTAPLVGTPVKLVGVKTWARK